MLREIIQAISGNLKFCLRNDRVFFVDKCHIQGKSINFVDVVVVITNKYTKHLFYD